MGQAVNLEIHELRMLHESAVSFKAADKDGEIMGYCKPGTVEIWDTIIGKLEDAIELGTKLKLVRRSRVGSKARKVHAKNKGTKRSSSRKGARVPAPPKAL